MILKKQKMDEDDDKATVVQAQHVVFLEHKRKKGIPFEVKGLTGWTNEQNEVLRNGLIGTGNLRQGAKAFGFLPVFEEELKRIENDEQHKKVLKDTPAMKMFLENMAFVRAKSIAIFQNGAEIPYIGPMEGQHRMMAYYLCLIGSQLKDEQSGVLVGSLTGASLLDSQMCNEEGWCKLSDAMEKQQWKTRALIPDILAQVKNPRSLFNVQMKGSWYMMKEKWNDTKTPGNGPGKSRNITTDDALKAMRKFSYQNRL